MVELVDAPDKAFWRCLLCHTPLTSDDLGLRCRGCGKLYPEIAGVTLLVREPAAYLRSERAALVQVSRHATQRIDLIDRSGRSMGLSEVALERNREVLHAEVAQAEALLALLKPARETLEVQGNTNELQSARRAGWTLDLLLPYLLRDWTNSVELGRITARIGTAIRQAFPDPSGRSVVFAGCGAGGLLAECPPGFEHVLGFDLALPILAAARRLLDGESFDLVLPPTLSKIGRVSLKKRDPLSDGASAVLSAMDALDTAFADGTVDCVVTMFLTDLIPDPLQLGEEIHRILSDNGVWINFGPSGKLKSLWRFDPTEGIAFFEAAGFAVIDSKEERTTNLDVSRDYPLLSSQNVLCTLTTAKKTKRASAELRRAMRGPVELAETIPQHFSGSSLTYRLDVDDARGVRFQCEWFPGQVQSFEIGGNAARIMGLVDGTRTVRQIADLHSRQAPSRRPDETIRAFGRYFEQGLLTWRGRSS